VLKITRILVILLFMLACLTNVAISNELKGTVCLGKNLAKSSGEHSTRLYLKVGNSKNIYFMRPYNGPEAVVKNLDINKDHMVYVYFDNRIVQSWELNFSNLKTASVLIWRASGSWRMEPNEASSCK